MKRRRLVQALASIALLPSLAWTRAPRRVEIRVEGEYFEMIAECDEEHADEIRALLEAHLALNEEKVAQAWHGAAVEVALTGSSVITGFTWEGGE